MHDDTKHRFSDRTIVVCNKILGSEIQIQPKTNSQRLGLSAFVVLTGRIMFGVAVQPLHTLPLPNTETVGKVQRLCKQITS
ncbi:hypothetical protein [Chlorogloeopsis sp. ULAP02]|uniref:hypothetical protein n=1 Tax=Chlorogloeopsis sp. ULAP02 TaxID=3107926 RepID=UPI0031350166